MAMNKATLGAALKSAREAVRDTYLKRDMTPAEQDAYMMAMCEADAEAIIDHIQNYGTIESLSTTSTPSGQGPHIHNPQTVESTGKIK